jgi:putative hemolysin
LENEPAGLLASILLGNLLINILFFCTGAAASVQWAASRGEWVEAVCGIALLVSLIIFGEIIPKAVGINHAEFVLRVAAVPLVVWFRITVPVRYVLHWVLQWFGVMHEATSVQDELTPGEFKELLESVQHEPGFGSQEKEILEDIVNLPSVRVREVMIPRIHVLRKPLDSPVGEIINEACRGEYSHVLIYREKDDEPLGFVRVRDIVFCREKSRSLEKFLHPLVFVPETKRADILLEEFLSNGWRLVAVVDEYGGLAGIITLEDLFAELVGEFEPEAEKVVQLDERTYRLSGRLPIRAWRLLFTGFLPGQEVESLAFDTLSGLIISLLGRMPMEGDEVFLRNLRLRVESMHNRRIEKVLVHLNEKTGGTS